MTWLTTWPEDGRPMFAEHATEAKAEAHATEIVRSKRAGIATAFWSESTEHIETETTESAA